MGDELWEGFLDPPAAARPRVWWHWMNGNIDEPGIRLDLEWMKRVGIGGAQVFEGGMNAPQLVRERVVFDSVEWRSAMRFAAATAHELRLELTIATSPGWSAAGGPWVEPVDAMKKIVWSEVIVDGGTVFQTLPDLPAVAGRYQDAPRWGSPPGDPRFARDTVVLALPALDVHDELVPDALESSSPIAHAERLWDGGFAVPVVLPRDLATATTQWITYRFDRHVTVGAATVGLPGPRGFGSPPPVLATLEVSDDGVAFRSIAELPATQSPVRSRSFDAVTARWFRLRLDAAPARDSVPPMAEGILPLPFPPPAAETLVSEFVLRGGGRVSASEEKAGFATTLDYYAIDTPAGVEASAVETVIDVTAFVRDGTLEWRSPPGRWRILRFGYSLTGHTNGPAPAEATGLEVDKLDAPRVASYLERWLRIFDESVGPDLMGEQGIRSLLSDSIESGPQNWTDSMLEEFEARRGYSAVPWLATIAGYVIGSAGESDRFLWDFRQTIAELYADNYYGTVSRVAHERGLAYYAEALEDHRPQLGDDMHMRSHADVPMGAMWMFAEADGAKPTYVADVKGASSVAHVYGKPFTGAESFSAFGNPYAYAPRHLKPVADLELALGVTRFCIHTSPHQPSGVRPPGISLTPHLGQTFTRNETWGEQAGPWTSYLARSSHVLNSGVPVADVAYFYGEEAPLTGVFGDSLPDEVPRGYDFDFVGADALQHVLRVAEDGTLRTPGGASYRVLYLGGTSARVTVGTLRRLGEFAAAGAVIVGARPSGSPSGSDDPAEFAAAVETLWGSAVRETTLSGALASIPPDWIADSQSISVTHRAVGAIDAYFVRNATSSAVTTTVTFRAAGAVEWWDAVTATRRALESSLDGDRTVVTLSLPEYGAGFVMIGGAAREVAPAQTRETLLQIDNWTCSRPDDPYFSGTATWTTTVDVTPEWVGGASVMLDLGDVRDLAVVTVNGHEVATLWTAPFETDITGWLVPGANRIEVAVTNTWANRLIGDAAHPELATTQLTGSVFATDAPTRPWGLLGPARLVGDRGIK